MTQPYSPSAEWLNAQAALAAKVRRHEAAERARKAGAYVQKMRRQRRESPGFYETELRGGNPYRTVVSTGTWRASCSCPSLANCWHMYVAIDRERVQHGLPPFGYYGKDIDSSEVRPWLAALNERDAADRRYQEEED